MQDVATAETGSHYRSDLVNGIIPIPVAVARAVIEAKRPSLLAFAELV